MASLKSWRRTHQVRTVSDRARRQAERRWDEERCNVMDAQGVRCPNPAVDLGYCAEHWGR